MASRRSTFDIFDNWLLVAAGVVAALFVWNIVGWLFGFVAFLVKVAIVAFVVTVAVRLGSGRHALRSGRRDELHR